MYKRKEVGIICIFLLFLFATMCHSQDFMGEYNITPQFPGNVEYADFALDANGNLHAAFSTKIFDLGGPASSDVWYATNKSGEWEFKNLTESNSFADMNPSIALTTSDMPVISYTSGISSSTTVIKFTGFDGANWNAPITISDATAVKVGNSCLAVAPNGTIGITYTMYSVHGYGDIIYTDNKGDISWVSNKVNLTKDSARQDNSVLAFNPTDSSPRVAFVDKYGEFEGLDSDIYYIKNATGGSPKDWGNRIKLTDNYLDDFNPCLVATSHGLDKILYTSGSLSGSSAGVYLLKEDSTDVWSSHIIRDETSTVEITSLSSLYVEEGTTSSDDTLHIVFADKKDIYYLMINDNIDTPTVPVKVFANGANVSVNATNNTPWVNLLNGDVFLAYIEADKTPPGYIKYVTTKQEVRLSYVYLWIDDNAGNANGLPETGENLIIRFKLKNQSPTTLTKIEAKIISTDSNDQVSFIDDEVTLPNAKPGEVVTCNQPGLKLSVGATGNNLPVELRANVKTNQGTYHVDFSIKLNPNKITISGFSNKGFYYSQVGNGLWRNSANSDQNNFWCSAACMHILCDYYDNVSNLAGIQNTQPNITTGGNLLPQEEIAHVMNVNDCGNASGGTAGNVYTGNGSWLGSIRDDVRRAGHFSNLSNSRDNAIKSGYSWQQTMDSRLGYTSIAGNWDTNKTLTQLKSILNHGYPVILHLRSWLLRPVEGRVIPEGAIRTSQEPETVLGHSVLLIGYDDSTGNPDIDTFEFHDPWFGPNVRYTQSVFYNYVWPESGMFGTYRYYQVTAPWDRDIILVLDNYSGLSGLQGQLTSTVKYTEGYLPATGLGGSVSGSQSFLTFEPTSGILILSGINPRSLNPSLGVSGTSGSASWTVQGDEINNYSIKSEGYGMISAISTSYGGYSDDIGGQSSVEFIVHAVPTPTYTATATATPTATPTSTNTPWPCNKGDVNCDGSITPGDALAAFNIFLRIYNPTGNEPCNVLCAADWNLDGSVSPGDGLCIFKEFLRDPC